MLPQSSLILPLSKSPHCLHQDQSTTPRPTRLTSALVDSLLHDLIPQAGVRGPRATAYSTHHFTYNLNPASSPPSPTSPLSYVSVSQPPPAHPKPKIISTTMHRDRKCTSAGRVTSSCLLSFLLLSTPITALGGDRSQNHQQPIPLLPELPLPPNTNSPGGDYDHVFVCYAVPQL